MLLYDVSYLAYTQTIDVPLSQAGDVLSNLWTAVVPIWAGNLMKRIHTSLRQRHPPFLYIFHNFCRLLSHILLPYPRIHRSGPGNIARERIDEASKEEDGWNLVDDDVQISFSYVYNCSGNGAMCT